MTPQVLDNSIHASVRAGVLNRPQMFVNDDFLGEVRWNGDTLITTRLGSVVDVPDITDDAILEEEEIPFTLGKPKSFWTRENYLLTVLAGVAVIYLSLVIFGALR